MQERIEYKEPTMFLSKKELHDLTGRIHQSSQMKVLRSLKIVFEPCEDGRILVLREHIRSKFGAITDKKKPKRKFKANWDALNAQE